MGLDYSQKQLIGAAFASKKRSKQTERLQFYAFLTGLASTLISLAGTIVIALKQ